MPDMLQKGLPGKECPRIPIVSSGNDLKECVTNPKICATITARKGLRVKAVQKNPPGAGAEETETI
jgi:hypothetical protein